MKIPLMGTKLFNSVEQTDRQTETQTDSHDEVNNLLSQFCERAKEQI